MVIFKGLALVGVAAALHSCPASLKREMGRPVPSTTYVCAKIKQYPKEVRDRAADELEAYADRVPTIAEWIADYGSLRAAMRRCPGV